MLEGTRNVRICVRAEGPADPGFGDEIDDDAFRLRARATAPRHRMRSLHRRPGWHRPPALAGG